MRLGGRAFDKSRDIAFIPNYIKYAEGSCLASFGNTKVICTATLEDRVPIFQKGTGLGWISAEYGMLPRATGTRNDREAVKGKQSGRTQEIQRLISRSLRATVDLRIMGERQIKIDCDVIQADGGTRTASICGGCIALYLALKKAPCRTNPFKNFVAAISCGILQGGEAAVDLDYNEDSNALVDANFVMLDDGKMVEVQGTGENDSFSSAQFIQMLNLAQNTIAEIIELQKATVF